MCVVRSLLCNWMDVCIFDIFFFLRWPVTADGTKKNELGIRWPIGHANSSFEYYYFSRASSHQTWRVLCIQFRSNIEFCFRHFIRWLRVIYDTHQTIYIGYLCKARDSVSFMGLWPSLSSSSSSSTSSSPLTHFSNILNISTVLLCVRRFCFIRFTSFHFVWYIHMYCILSSSPACVLTAECWW